MANKSNSGMRKAGGGAGSRINKTVPVRTGAPARGLSPGAVSQFGSSVGNHATGDGPPTSYRGETFLNKLTPAGGAVPLGNQVALNVGKGGPGAGRTVMRSGAQGQHGAVAGTSKPQGREILRDFGPDSAAVRNRR
jgi:hypothetical protein